MLQKQEKSITIATFLNAPATYRIPIFTIIAEKHRIRTNLYYKCKHWSPGWDSLTRIYPYTISSSVRIFGKVFCLPPRALVRGLLRRRYETLIISGWGGVIYIFFHLLCYFRGIPVVVLSDTSVRSSRSVLKKFVRKHILKWILSRTATAIASGKLAAKHLSEMGFQGPIFIGHYAVDIDTFFPVQSDEKDDRLKLLFVGRLIERKRAIDVVKAVSQLIDNDVPVSLKIAGDGPCFDGLKEIVLNYRSSNEIELLGPVCHDKLPVLMQKMDVMVVPSRNEPWGVVVAEAAASGLALLLSNEVGAAPEFLIPGENGYIFNVCDINSLVQKISKLLEDKKRGRMSEMKRLSRHVAEKFSMDSCGDVYSKAIFTAVIANR